MATELKETQSGVWHPSVAAAFIAWVVLIVSTLVSWGTGSGSITSSASLGAIIVIAVAYIKIRVVGLYFMELKDAPKVLRGLFEGYCLFIALGILVLYYLL